MAETRAPERRLARRAAASGGNVQELLLFALAGELYGVSLTRVKEILSPPPLTRVPRAADDVLGVCSVRGLLVTVVDLRRRLRVEGTPPTRRARVLLAEADDGEVLGLYVDEVREVLRLAETEIEPVGTSLGNEAAEWVAGIARPRGTIVLVVNLSEVFAR